MVKTYVSKYYLELHTEMVMPDGARKRISFVGGRRGKGPRRINGRFTTADETLQKVIESQPSFGESYYLLKGNKKTKKTKEKPTTKVEGVSSVSEAKTFLADKENGFDVKLSELPNKEAILAKARELGIEFTNLK